MRSDGFQPGRFLAFLCLSLLSGRSEAAPAEVANLLFGGAQSISWSATGGSAGYHLYRGTPAGARAGDFGVCLLGSAQGLAADPGGNPPPGGIYLYHLSAFDSAGEGSLGTTSGGSPRIPSVPCTPARRFLDLTTAGTSVDGVEDGASARRNPSLALWTSPREQTAVVLHTGEFRLDAADLRLGGRGNRDPEEPGALPWAMTRHYRSQVTYEGPLGPGWDFDYNARLRPTGSDALFHDGQGRRELFVRQSATRFSSPRGLYAILIQNPSGSFTLRDPDGVLRDFHAFDGSNRQGSLEAISDRNGNRITLTYDGQGLLVGMVDVLGRSITFQYDSGGRLTSVGDDSGRVVLYGYDSGGRLISVRSPLVLGTPNGNDFPSGKTTSYRYDTAATDPRLRSNITAVVAPREGPAGAPFLENAYGASPGSFSFDRVVLQQIGGTNATGVPAGGTQTFSYTSLNPFSNPASPTIPRRQVLWSDRLGNERVLVHNAIGNALTRLDRTNHSLRPGEGDYLTSNTYNVDGELQQRTFPAGNREIRGYDSGAPDRSRHGNLLSITRLPDAAFSGGRGDGHGGEIPNAVTTYGYEPIYNQVASIIDPRGNNPGFVPPNGGVWSPARYRLTRLFDYQEGDPAATGLAAYATRFGLSLSGFAVSLGDLNGDGQATAIAGDLVRTDAAAATLDPASQQAAIEGDTSQDARSLLRYNAHGQVVAAIDPEGNRNDYDYHPETDPDGDGVPTPPPADGRILDPVTGGSLRFRVLDAASAPGRDNGTDPTPAAVRSDFLWDARGNLTDSIDGRGIRTRAIVNALGQVVEIRRAAATADAGGPHGDPATGRGETGLTPYGYRTRMSYDANDNLSRLEIEDAGMTRGVGPFVTTIWSHNILDDVIQSARDKTAGVTAITTLNYDAGQNLIGYVRPEGNGLDWAYDERGLVLSHTRGASGPRGGAPAVRTFDYDGNRSATRVVDARGGIHDYLYDGLDQLARTIDPVGSTDEIYRDPAGQVTRLLRRGPVGGPTPPDRSGSGNVDLSDTRFGWDERGRLFRTDRALFVPPGTSLARSPSLSEGPLTPGDGQISTFLEYDRASRRTFIVKDSGSLWRWDFDGVHRPLKLTDAALGTWLWTYDANHNGVELLQTEVPTGPPALAPASFASTAFYDSLDRIGSVVDPLGNTQWWQYDSLDAVVGDADALGPVSPTILRRTPGAPVVVAINLPGNVTRIAYDAMGHEIRTDRVLTATRQGNGTWTPTPDTTNPFNPDGLITLRTTYDRNSLPLSFEDDKGNVTTMAYDNHDRQVSVQADDQTVETMQYDGEGLCVFRVDANGTMTTSSCDAAGRLASRIVSPAPGVEGTTQQLFEHDGSDRVTYASDDNGPGSGDDLWNRVAYDSLGRVIEETQGTALGAFYIDTSWQAEDQRQGLVYPSGRQIQYQFDPAERLVSAYDFGSGLSASFEYYGLNRVHTVRFGNGVRATRLNDAETFPVGFDAARRTILLRYLGSGPTLLAGFQYRYDRIGEVTGLRRQHHPGPSGSFNGDTFTFDSGRRLVGFQTAFLNSGFAPITTASESMSLQLDGAGNAATFVHNGVSYLNSPNNLNEYDEPQSGGTRFDDGLPNDFHDIASTPFPDGLNLAHDRSGNEVDTGLFRIAFDFLDRPVRVTRKSDNAPVAAYAYDGLGRRGLRSVTNSGALDRNQILLYGGHPRPRLLEERDGLGGTTREIVYGANASDRLFQMSVTAGYAYLMQDAEGSAAGLIDPFSANVLERVTYSAVGKPQFRSPSNSALLDPFGNFVPESQYGAAELWRGLRYDPETGQRTNQISTDIAGIYMDGARPLSALTGKGWTRGSPRAWDPLGGGGNTYSLPRSLTALIGPFELIPDPSDNPLQDVKDEKSWARKLVDFIFGFLPTEDALEKQLKDIAAKLEKAAKLLREAKNLKDLTGTEGPTEAEAKAQEILDQVKKINDFLGKLKKAKKIKTLFDEGEEDPIATLKMLNELIKGAMDMINKVDGGAKLIGGIIDVYVKALDSTIGLIDLIPWDYSRFALDMYRRWCKGDPDPVACALQHADAKYQAATDKDRENARRRIEAEMLKENPPAPQK